MIILFKKQIGFLGILGPPYCGIGNPIRIGREMLCLLYAGFFFFFGLLMNTILIKLTANICLFLQLFQLFNALCVSEGGMKGAQWDTVITD